MEEMRINKFLSHYGVCSRREADRRIEAGAVMIDGRVAVFGDKVSPGQTVSVDGVPVNTDYETVILAYHKPVGIICTTSDKERPNLNDAIDIGYRVFPIGRLDKDSSGLLLLTNDGDLADELMRGRNMHEKEYIVRTDKPLTDGIVKAMEQGVLLDDRLTRPCRIFNRDKNSFHIVLTEGRNRQIRRMCEYFDLHVVSLFRTRFVNVEIGDLKEGTYRRLSVKEEEALKRG